MLLTPVNLSTDRDVLYSDWSRFRGTNHLLSNVRCICTQEPTSRIVVNTTPWYTVCEEFLTTCSDTQWHDHDTADVDLANQSVQTVVPHLLHSIDRGIYVVFVREHITIVPVRWRISRSSPSQQPLDGHGHIPSVTTTGHASTVVVRLRVRDGLDRGQTWSWVNVWWVDVTFSSWLKCYDSRCHRTLHRSRVAPPVCPPSPCPTPSEDSTGCTHYPSRQEGKTSEHI